MCGQSWFSCLSWALSRLVYDNVLHCTSTDTCSPWELIMQCVFAQWSCLCLCWPACQQQRFPISLCLGTHTIFLYEIKQLMNQVIIKIPNQMTTRGRHYSHSDMLVLLCELCRGVGVSSCAAHYRWTIATSRLDWIYFVLLFATLLGSLFGQCLQHCHHRFFLTCTSQMSCLSHLHTIEWSEWKGCHRRTNGIV